MYLTRRYWLLHCYFQLSMMAPRKISLSWSATSLSSMKVWIYLTSCACVLDEHVSSVLLFCVCYKGRSYNFPIVLWLMDSFPFTPPICFLTPTHNMIIREGKHVDAKGRIYLPALSKWDHVRLHSVHWSDGCYFHLAHWSIKCKHC